MTKEVLNFEVAKSVTIEYQIRNTFGAYALCQALESAIILPPGIEINLDVIKSLNENPTYIGTSTDNRDYFATLEEATVTITSQYFYLESR